MFGPQHAPVGQSCLNWARKAPRVPPAACNTPTFARMAKTNHVWPTACSGRSVMPETGSECTQSASSCLSNTNNCQKTKINHVWPTACSGMPELGSESTQSASSCLPHTNMHQNGQNQSSIMVGPQHAQAGQSCLKRAQKAPRVPPAACHTPQHV
jgi:hypothetical protein